MAGECEGEGRHPSMGRAGEEERSRALGGGGRGATFMVVQDVLNLI